MTKGTWEQGGWIFHTVRIVMICCESTFITFKLKNLLSNKNREPTDRNRGRLIS